MTCRLMQTDHIKKDQLCFMKTISFMLFLSMSASVCYEKEYLQAFTNCPDVRRQGYAANFVAMTMLSRTLDFPGT